MKRKIDSESLPLKNWKKEATMFQDDYTAGAGTSWLLNVAKAENKMIWEMIRVIEEAPTLTPPNEPLTPYPDGDMSIIACPRCGSGEYLHNEDGNEQNFCGQCGQRIDWSRPPEGEEDA